MADFQREYGLSPDDVWGMPTSHFKWLLNGLSKQSRFIDAINDKPKRQNRGGSRR